MWCKSHCIFQVRIGKRLWRWCAGNSGNEVESSDRPVIRLISEDGARLCLCHLHGTPQRTLYFLRSMEKSIRRRKLACTALLYAAVLQHWRDRNNRGIFRSHRLLGMRCSVVTAIIPVLALCDAECLIGTVLSIPLGTYFTISHRASKMFTVPYKIPTFIHPLGVKKNLTHMLMYQTLTSFRSFCGTLHQTALDNAKR